MDMEALGREIAEAVVGPGVIDDVQVRPGSTFENEPTVEFYFRVHSDRIPFRPGLIHIRLSQHLQDRLSGAGEQRAAIVHLLDHQDWQAWTDA